MSNELTIKTSVKGLKGTQKTDFDVTTIADQAANGGLDTIYNITDAAAGTQVDISSFVSTPGACGFQNIDVTATIELGIQDGGTFFPFLSLPPGRSDSGADLAITTFYAKSSSGTVKLRVFCNEK